MPKRRLAKLRKKPAGTHRPGLMHQRKPALMMSRASKTNKPLIPLQLRLKLTKQIWQLKPRKVLIKS